MTIHFYLDDENETQICSFYDIQSNPFKVLDIISLDINELFPIEYNKLPIELQEIIYTDDKAFIEKFRLKKIQINREWKSIRTASKGEARLTIEYHCQFVED